MSPSKRVPARAAPHLPSALDSASHLPTVGRMQVNLHHGPFSRFGSHLTLQYVPAFWNRPGLLLRSVRAQGGIRELFTLLLMRGNTQVPSAASASATRLTLAATDGSAHAEFTFASPDRIQFRCVGADLSIQSIAAQIQHAFATAPGAITVNAPEASTRLLFRSLAGTFTHDCYHRVRTGRGSSGNPPPTGPWVNLTFGSSGGSPAEGAIDDCPTSASAPGSPGSFETALAASTAAWNAWRDATPAVAEPYRDAAEAAMYINYAAGVLPSATTVIRRPTILMSKNWMTRCWSWDHCFNAVAHRRRQPDLAWDQWRTLFDWQGTDGSLPDSISPGRLDLNFCKPPVHGWALDRLLEVPAIATPDRLADAHRVLGAWTDWWFQHRDVDHDGLPEYQHGNDSGWDNATAFDEGVPLASPELAAFLVVQLRTVGSLAERLGLATEAAARRAHADTLATRLVEAFSVGDALRPRLAHGGAHVRTGDCLLPFLALLGGPDLPASLRESLVRGISVPGRFQSPFGLATEALDSPHHAPDSYWRGPAWGSSTVLVTEGLLRSGYPALAADLARVYCDNCVRTACFAENFDPRTGDPLCDLAYTWGSSAFLFLAETHFPAAG